MSRKKEQIEKLTDVFDEPLIDNESTKLATHCCEDQRLMHQQIEEMNEEKEITRNNQNWCLGPSTIVHILVTIFGISAWIGVNGIFIQLPLLVTSLPERWSLAAHLVIAIQAANIVAIIYGLLRKSFKINELFCIIGMLGTATLAMGLLAFLYNKTSYIAGQEYSTVLIALTFVIAAVSCASSILFMPYLRNFKEVYLISYFIGEGLSGVIPSIIALAQGINESPVCNDNTNNTETSNSTLPRFSSQIYFLFIFILLILSSVGFLFLENLSYVKSEKIPTESSDNNSLNTEINQNHYDKKISVLSKDSTFENSVFEKQDSFDTFKKTDVGNVPNVYYTQNNSQLTFKIVYLYILLSVICLLANGLLPGLQPYSCLSYGNMTYHLSAIFSQIANPTACILALRFLPQGKKIIHWMTIVIFLVSGYVIYLALASPNPPFRDLKVGKALVILSWILVMGLISFVKLLITSVFRSKSAKALFHVGVVMQVGSASGALLSFIIINFTNLLHEYKPCNGLAD